MDTEIKRRWVAALRSGNFTQGRGRLAKTTLDSLTGKSRTSHCCLGVLCELAVEDGVVDRVPVPGDVFKSVAGYSYGGSSNYLSATVQQWAGLRSHNPIVAKLPLSTHNDSVPDSSFDRIADLIEEYL